MAITSLFVRGAEKIAQRIRTIRDNLSVLVLADGLSDLLVRRTLERFDREVDPDNRPWAPLKESTLRRKGRKGGKQTGKMLVQTGEMRGAIRRIRGAGTGLIAANTGAGFRIGVDDPAQYSKARAHQYGTPTIPARRFLGVGALDRKSVDSYLRRRADKAMTE